MKHPAVRWKIAGACVTGQAHEARGIPCQDAWAAARSAQAVAVCLCDGASSARRSDSGARSAAAAVADYLCRKVTDSGGHPPESAEVLRVARAGIQRMMLAQGGEWPDCACTLLALVIGQDRATAYHLGDGLIVMVDHDTPVVLSAPEHGEFVNETRFITDEDAIDHLRRITVDLSSHTTTFALMTDGVQHAVYDRRTGGVAGAVQEMASWLDHDPEDVVSQDLHATLQEYVWPHTYDDCTIVVLRSVRSTEHGPAGEHGRARFG